MYVGEVVECLYPPQAPADLTCAAGNPGLIFTDEIDPTTGWSGDVGTGMVFGELILVVLLHPVLVLLLHIVELITYSLNLVLVV